MSGNKDNQQSAATSSYALESEYAYVTAEGELFQKSNKYFDGRQLATIEEDISEAALKPYREAFDTLEKKRDALRTQIEQGDDPETDLQSVNDLLEEARQADAIGDFDNLMDELETMKKELEEAKTSAVTEDTEQQEAETEEVTTAEAETDQAESEADQTTEEAAAEKSTGDSTSEVDEPAGEQEAPDTETEKDESEESSEETAAEEDEEKEGIDYYRDIVNKAETVVELQDWSYGSVELDNLSHRWEEGPDVDEELDEKKAKLLKKFQQLQDDFEEARRKHYEELNRQKKENLEKRQKLLDELKEIVEQEKWQSQKQVGRIRNRWDSLKPLPKDEEEKQDAEFERLVKIFDDHKVDFLVKRAQQEEDNLAGKMLVLDKMENLAKSIESEDQDWKELDKKFDQLTKQWKKIGRVPRDRSREVFSRYKNAQDAYYEKKFKYNKSYRKEIEKYLSKKKALIKEAEALMDEEDLAKGARKINKLHRRWKKVGNLPQKDENELWDQFKAATDAFNERKSENIDLLREQEEGHYQQKLELIEKAEEIKDTEEWKKGHDTMQQLMKRWKEIGPVPRKKSRKIWKKFKGAMDHFYERRREHFREVREKQKENLKAKQEVLEKLRALGDHEDPIEAVNQAKPLQEEFKSIGYVPIKQKNKIWKQYRKACDVIYDRFRAAKSENQDDRKLAAEGLDPDDRAELRKKRKEYGKLKSEISKLEEEILQFKEAQTYFKASSNKGNALQDQIKEKIEKAEKKLSEKQDKLDDIGDEMDEIRNTDEED